MKDTSPAEDNWVLGLHCPPLPQGVQRRFTEPQAQHVHVQVLGVSDTRIEFACVPPDLEEMIHQSFNK